MSPVYAVIANPVSHSCSPEIHQLFAQELGIKLQYMRILGDIKLFETQVAEFFKKGGKGLNISLPFKEQAFLLASKHTKRCMKAKAANTLWMESGSFCADNTDGMGFINDIKRYIDLKNKSVLILGAGGAAKGIIGPLFDSSIKQLILSNRTLSKAEKLKEGFPKLIIEAWLNWKTNYDVIINATSISTQQKPLQLSDALFTLKPFCYDLGYDLKQDTPFVKLAKTHGCRVVDGFGMLVEQAAESFLIWHGKKPDTSVAINKLRN